MLAQHLHHLVALHGAHLQHNAELLVEQRLERELVAARAHLGRPVLRIAIVGAAVGDAIALGHEQVDVEGHAHVARECHLAGRSKEAAVAAVVIGQDLALGPQGVDRIHEVDQVLRLVQIRHFMPHLVQHLRQHAAAHAVAPATEVDEDQRGVFGGFELRRQRAAHVGQRRECADDQAHGRRDLFLLLALAPLRAHGQAVLAHGDRNAQGRAQFHAHGAHGGVEVGVLALLAARGHPVGRELDALQFDRRGQQVGDGFRHGHAAGRGRVDHGQRRALAHAHRLAGEALVVGQRHRAVGHRHLPGPDHLVAVREAAHRAVADGHQEALGRHRRVAQHLDRGVLQAHRRSDPPA